ncbi:MAG: c-type cytochrome [Burkholderiaceae bacterium]
MQRFTQLALNACVISACLGVTIDDLACAATPDYPQLAGATSEGRMVWIDTCEACHAYGIAGSPNPLDPDDWRHRVAKPRIVLYKHAIEGFFGPDDTQMPARGGNDSLSDTQVKAAVDYMVALAKKHLNQIKEDHDSRPETTR